MIGLYLNGEYISKKDSNDISIVKNQQNSKIFFVCLGATFDDPILTPMLILKNISTKLKAKKIIKMNLTKIF